VANHTYRVIDVVGSADTVDAAIRNAVNRAAKTTRNLEWFEVAEIRGHIDEGAVAHVQVSMKLGFRLDDPD
jgi:flavin-binding protein dodecin